MATSTVASTHRAVTLDVLLRLLTAVGLLVDAAVHLHLAAGYQAGSSTGLGAGNLFRLEALAAVAAAVYVLWRGSARACMLALLVAVSAFGAVVLYRYVNVPAFGPLPAMYEPMWFPEKALSAAAEAAAALSAAVLLTRVSRRQR